jgi:trigger factor
MNISKENVNELNAIVKVKLKPEDYQPQVDTVLRKHQKNAKIPGFRPGKVPAGLIKKMYGKSIVVEEVNKLLSSKIYQFLNENNIEILGNPLPKENTESQIDWENPTDFEFLYDLGLAPQFQLNLLNEKMTCYVPIVDDAMVDKELENIVRKFGVQTFPEEANVDSLLYGEFIEVDNEGNTVEGGIIHTTSFTVTAVKDLAVRKLFAGIKKEEKITINIKKAFVDVTEIAYMLGIPKDAAENLTADFSVRITNIVNVEPAALNVELFDKVYGAGEVADEQSFRAKIKEDLARMLHYDTDRKLRKDITKKILTDLNLSLPDDFLKRWLMHVSENPVTLEQIDAEYDKYRENLQWKLVENKIARENDIKLSSEEVLGFAKQVIRQQFMQYGYYDFPEDKLEEYAKGYLEKEEERRRIQETLVGNKTFEILKGKFTLDNKEVGYEEFIKIVNA